MLQACTAGLGQVMQLMQKVHTVAVASYAVVAAADAAHTAPDAAAVGPAGGANLAAADRRVAVERVAQDGEEACMLFDERISDVRRSKELLSAQHDTLCQLMRQRGHLERRHYWRARGADVEKSA